MLSRCLVVRVNRIGMGTSMGKGSGSRVRCIGREEEEIRWKLYTGHITFKQFEARMKKLKKQGLVRRKF